MTKLQASNYFPLNCFTSDGFFWDNFAWTKHIWNYSNCKYLTLTISSLEITSHEITLNSLSWNNFTPKLLHWWIFLIDKVGMNSGSAIQLSKIALVKLVWLWTEVVDKSCQQQLRTRLSCFDVKTHWFVIVS